MSNLLITKCLMLIYFSYFQTREIYYTRDSYICVVRLVYGYTLYFSNNPQMVDANKRNYSNLHSTKIPTFIHLSLSSQKTSRKWKSGSVQKKHISQHVYGNRLSALSTTKRSGNISHNGKLRIPFEDFTNTTDPTTGIRKPEPIKF
ncbi:unnamed protein product [Schistosoma spindalis]|nr:unnamed protein product [Schistosoma spindale]